MAVENTVQSDPDVSQGLMEALFESPRKAGREKAPVPIQEPRPIGVAAKGVASQNANAPSTAPQSDAQPDSGEPTVEDLADQEAPPPDSRGYDDEDEFEVQVDGETQKVKLKDLKSRYSGEGAIEKRLQQATQTRNEVKQHLVQLYDANNNTLARLQQLDQALQQFAEPNIDWNWLRANDPQQYTYALENQAVARARQEQVRQEAAQVQQRQEAVNSHAMELYLNDQASKLAERLPELADPNKSQAFMGRIQKAVKHFGYTDQELKEVTDHRVFVVLDYASRYLELLDRKNSQNGSNNAGPSATLRTATSNQPPSSNRKREEAAVNRARRTGHPDDVAATLLVAPRRSRG